MIWVWIIFGFQALLMAIDEGYFHRRRGLPLWERIGHPIDTVGVLVTQYAVLFTQWSDTALIILAGISTLLITKDEWVHHRECEATETWLHSLLFVIHPVHLGLWIWLRQEDQVSLHFQELLTIFIATLTVGVFQVLYWNTPLIRKPI